MPRLTRKRGGALLGIAAIALGGALSWATVVRSANSPTPVIFADVTPSVLSSRGIDLTVPTTTAPAAAGLAAATAASEAFGGVAVLESHFAHCTAPGGVDQDCWAVSLDPSSFHSNPMEGSTTPPITATYMIVLVDPTTDHILHSQDGAGS